MAALADHRIDRLQVRLPAGQAARAEQVRRALLLSSWPELGADEVVVVRRVHLRTTWSELDRTLGERLHAAIAHGERRHFRSASAVLSELSRDLARGTAAQAWWWQSWSDLLPLPTGEALARLWSRHVTWLPEVVVELERTQALSEVWQHWTTANAVQVLGHVLAEHRLPWSVESLLVQAQRTALVAAEQPHHLAALTVPPRLVRRWHPLLHGHHPADPRTLLALVLDGVSTAPLSLQQTNGAETLAAWSLAVTTNHPRPADATAVAVSTSPDAAKHSADPSVPNHQAIAPSAAPSASTYGTSAAHADVRTDPPEQAATLAPTAVQDPLGLPSRYAGVVFLVNVLRHPRVLELIDTTGWFTAVPHAWHVVVALARHLGIAADDPVARTLEELLEADGTTALATTAIGAALAACAAELYGEEVWNPRLLQETGRFQLIASHLDVWLPLSVVRLPLRLAGLDLTPGWTPWLGRVVTIHFVTTPLHVDLPPLPTNEDATP